MSLIKCIYRKEIINSPLNGEVVFKKFFFTKQVTTGYYYQSGSYVYRMWAKILNKIPKEFVPKKILVLGVGGGSVISTLRKKYKNSHIIAVDYDKLMIDTAKNFKFLKNNSHVEFIISDALEYISLNKTKFDLILIDIYNWDKPHKEAYSQDFILGLHKSLDDFGILLLNHFKYPDLKIRFDEFFSSSLTIKYLFNKLSLYRKFFKGSKNDQLPKEFLPYFFSKFYLACVLKHEKNLSLIPNIKNGYAYSYKIGPIFIEEYITNSEPEIQKSNQMKLVIWKRSIKNQALKHWHKIPKFSYCQNGVVDIHDMEEDYYNNWSENEKRNRLKWVNKDCKDFEIIKVDYNTFKLAYIKARNVGFSLRLAFLQILDYNLKGNSNNVDFLCVKNKITEQIVSGLAVVNYPDISQSCHLVSFVNEEVKKTSIGVAIIDFWYKSCINKGIRFLNFGVIWKSGDPYSWKGYSKFKLQFNPLLYCLVNNSYFKIVKN